jgi:hypothetical protein
LRETSTKPRLLVLAAALAVATALATLAVFAAEARADSFDSRPPQGVLMKDSRVLQKRDFTGGNWTFYKNGNLTGIVFDNFGEYTFPKADAVGAGTKLHVKLAKPERPGILIVAHPKVKDGQFGGKYPAGQGQQLKHTFKRVERDGKTVAWNVFFRVNEPARQYYLVVHAHWAKVPGTHVSYGDAGYAFHVKTR